jgi:hypothetical protein
MGAVQKNFIRAFSLKDLFWNWDLVQCEQGCKIFGEFWGLNFPCVAMESHIWCYEIQ